MVVDELDAQEDLLRWIEALESGTVREIMILRRGSPVAVMVAIDRAPSGLFLDTADPGDGRRPRRL